MSLRSCRVGALVLGPAGQPTDGARAPFLFALPPVRYLSVPLAVCPAATHIGCARVNMTSESDTPVITVPRPPLILPGDGIIFAATANAAASI